MAINENPKEESGNWDDFQGLNPKEHQPLQNLQRKRRPCQGLRKTNKKNRTWKLLYNENRGGKAL